MSSITKTGIILSKEMDESDAMYIAKLSTPAAYTPSTANNSTITPLNVLFDYTNTTASTVYRAIAKITYSGFDRSNTSGTFQIYWQGARYEISSGTWIWVGTNYITNSFNSFKDLTTLVLASTSGSFTYNTTFTLPSDFRSTYSGCQIGLRSNYSNGTARISIDEITVMEDKYSSDGSSKAHIANDYIACKEIIEI